MQGKFNLLEHSVGGAGCGRHVAGTGDVRCEGGHGLGGVEFVTLLEVGVVRYGRGDADVPSLTLDDGLVHQVVGTLGQNPFLELLRISCDQLLVLKVRTNQ